MILFCILLAYCEHGSFILLPPPLLSCEHGHFKNLDAGRKSIDVFYNYRVISPLSALLCAKKLTAITDDIAITEVANKNTVINAQLHTSPSSTNAEKIRKHTTTATVIKILKAIFWHGGFSLLDELLSICWEREEWSMFGLPIFNRFRENNKIGLHKHFYYCYSNVKGYSSIRWL